MIEKGLVLGINKDTVTIKLDNSAACFGCMNQECRKNSGLITAENTEHISLSPGDEAKVELPLASLATQALGLLLPPLLGFLAGYIAGGLIFDTAESRIGGGVAGLFAGAAFFLLIKKRFPAQKPKIVA